MKRNNKSMTSFRLSSIGYLTSLTAEQLEDELRDSLSVLSIFLSDSVNNNAQDFIDWACGLKWKGEADTQQSASIGTNTTYLEREGEVITLMNEWDDYMNPLYKLVISRTEFVHLLKQWGELYKQQPKEIVLIVEDEKYTLEGRN